eukprot:6342226-Pyramimonas_sp.AAC.1
MSACPRTCIVGGTTCGCLLQSRQRCSRKASTEVHASLCCTSVPAMAQSTSAGRFCGVSSWCGACERHFAASRKRSSATSGMLSKSSTLRRMPVASMNIWLSIGCSSAC